MSEGGKKRGDSGESSAELTLPDELRRVPAAGRITLGFSGPPLTLPGASDEAEDPDAPLTLDTGELSAPPAPDAPPRPQIGPLELELDDLGPSVSGDGWRRDHQRRSTPPPDDNPWTDAQRAAVAPTVSPLSMTRRRGASGAGTNHSPANADGGALGLVERSRPSQPDLDLAAEMAERYALGDFTGALRAAELLLGREDAHPEAERYAQSSRERLVQLYESRLGDTSQIPLVQVPPTEIRWLGLDHRAGFLLSRVDGEGTMEQLLDVSGMPRLEALKTLVELVEAGAVRFK